jgi:hypothetical protein
MLSRNGKGLLGSEQIPVDAINGTAYRFKGRAFDRDVWITYLCKDGALRLGDYRFPEGKYDEGVIDYLAAYNTLVSVYGPPFMAYAQHGEMTAELVVPVTGAATRDEYHASWKVQGLSVHVDLKAHGDYADGNWHAGVVVTPAGK